MRAIHDPHDFRSGVKPSWNYFIEIRRLSKHFVAQTRDIAWRSFYYFSLLRTFCTTNSISFALRNPLHCVHMQNFRSVFGIGIAPRFLSKFNKRSLILNIIHEELQYPSEILSIVSCHLLSRIYYLIHHLSYVFFTILFSFSLFDNACEIIFWTIFFIRRKKRRKKENFYNWFFNYI